MFLPVFISVIAQDHLSHAIALVAKTNNMTFAAFPTKEEQANADLGDRYVVSQVFGIPLEPAPYTPEEGGVFEMFAGTIKCVGFGCPVCAELMV